MNREQMILAIEGEIARLEQVRKLLLQSSSERFTPIDEGRMAPGKQARKLSPDARRRIAQAQERRWARERREKALGAESKIPPPTIDA